MPTDDDCQESEVRSVSGSVRAVLISMPVLMVAPFFVGLFAFGGGAVETLIAVGVVAALIGIIWLVCT